MDITLSIIIGIILFFITFFPQNDSLFWKSLRVACGIFVIGIIASSIFFIDYKDSKYEEPIVKAFIYNSAEDVYYFEFNGEHLKSKEEIPGFNRHRIDNSDFDSCFIYKAIRPKILGFFENKAFSEQYQFRQGRDLILESKLNKNKIKLK